jgi:hypothetical protein
LLGAGAAAVGATLLGELPAAQAAAPLTSGDEAILRFLSAAEILETDLWQQYNELGGIPDREVPGGRGNKKYTDALSVLDGDMAQYIHDNTEDELTHFTFINAYLASRGGRPVNLDQFRTLHGSRATGAKHGVKRLTNLMELTVDTTWWTRYRSRTGNPDLGNSSRPAVPGLLKGKFPAIPVRTTICARSVTSRRSPIRPAFTSRRSSRVARAFIPRSRRESATRRCSGSCSALAPPRQCTSRPGRTRRATPRR